MLARDVGGHTTNGTFQGDWRSCLVPPAIPVAIATAPPTTATAAALPSASPAATAAPLFGSIAALAVNRTVPTGFKWHCSGLSATGADHSCASAHPGASARTGAVTTLMLGMGRRVATAGGPLLSLAAWFAAAGRGVAALLEELLFTCGESKFLTAVATGK
jgi:hypothetical protein